MADPGGNNTGSGGALGAAGGDLTGSYPNPTVALIGGLAISAVATGGALPASQLPALGGDVVGTAGTTTITVLKSSGINIGPAGTATIGQIPGIASATAAVTGNIGEFISSALVSGSAKQVATGTSTSIISIPLSAGDWDVWGSGFLHLQTLTVVTSLSVGISTASNTALPGLTSGAQSQIGLGGGLTGGVDTGLSCGPAQVILAAAGTAFLNGSFAFATSTAAVYGVIQARRRR